MNYYNKTANGYIEHLEKNNFAMLNWIAYLYLSFSILPICTQEPKYYDHLFNNLLAHF